MQGWLALKQSWDVFLDFKKGSFSRHSLCCANEGHVDKNLGFNTTGSEMAEVVAYLRREKETLEVQASLAGQEAGRWKAQAAHAERAAEEARQVGATCRKE